MKGHVRQRGDAWELRVYRGRDPLTRRPVYRTKTVRGVGKREAERLLAALVVEEDALVSGTFGDLAERWYALRAPDWSPKTAKETRWMLDGYLAPLMGTPLTRLTPVKLDMFFSALRVRGGKDGQPLSAASVRCIHTVIRSALNQRCSVGDPQLEPRAARLARRDRGSGHRSAGAG